MGKNTKQKYLLCIYAIVLLRPIMVGELEELACNIDISESDDVSR